jgi:hypothetical protein
MALVFMENNQGKLFDLKQFHKMDDLSFPAGKAIDSPK